MNTSLDFSESFQAIMASDPILSYLSSGGDWFTADQMYWQQELDRSRSALTSNPTPENRRREAEALVGLCQMSTEEFKRVFPERVVATYDSSDTRSVASVVSERSSGSSSSRPRISWAPTPASSAKPMTKSGLHRSSAPRSTPRSALKNATPSTPQRPTKPSLPMAPQKPPVGIQSRFAALMDSDSE